MAFTKYQALLKTVELGSITRAAETMGYTQSAVSRAIAELEREWDLELLTRNRGGVTLSSNGAVLLPYIQAVCNGAKELEEQVAELHGMTRGTLRVGTFTSVSDVWLPGLLTSFQQQYPNIEFELLNSENYAEIESWIRHGKVDCGFVSLPTASELQACFLKRDVLMAVLPLEHPLADQSFFPVRRLELERFIKLKEDVDYEISRFLDQLPFRPSPRYEVSNDHTILSMVEKGLGMSIMHSLMAEDCRYRVAWKSFDHCQYRDIGIATAKNVRLSSAVRLFVEHVQDQVKTVPADGGKRANQA